MGEELTSKQIKSTLERDGYECVICHRNALEVLLKVTKPSKNGFSEIQLKPVTLCSDCFEEPRQLRWIATPIEQETDVGVIAARKSQIEGLERARKRSAKKVLKLLDDQVKWHPEKKSSVMRFVEKLGSARVEKAAHIANERPHPNLEIKFKYFAGICWNWIKDR